MKYESGEILERIKNSQLVCRDCKHRFNDSVMLGNTGKCGAYKKLKPTSVLCGGNCLYYEREDV